MATSIARQHDPALNLAEIEPFPLGSATVDPGHRRICWNGECSEEIEPRVMKVLVTLAQAEGHVVSRDRLIHLCWDDRIVGDDAINRCIQSIRRIAKRIQPPAFRIETTARVGYTLIAEWTDRGPGPVAAAFLPRKGGSTDVGVRPTKLLSIGAATLALAGGTAVLPHAGDTAMTRIAITADSDRDAQLASDLKVDLNQFAGGTLTDVSLVDSPRKSDLVVRVRTSRDGQVTRGNLTMADGRRKDMLWSATAELPAVTGAGSGTGIILRGQLAAKLGNLFACASKMANKDRNSLDTGAKRLFLAACTNMDDVAEQHDVDMLKKLTATAPWFAAGWSYLALAEAELLTGLENLGGRTTQSARAWQIALADLRRAQLLDPDLGTTSVAAVILAPPSDWARRLNTLEQGIARDPDEYLLHQTESFVFSSVGLTDSSIDAARRASELKPFSVDARANLIWALVHGGELARARAELDAARQLWPAATQLRDVRFSIELRYGDARAAQRMIESGEVSSGPNDCWAVLLRARMSPTKRNVSAVVNIAAHQWRGAYASPTRLLTLTQFDANDEAYAMFEEPGSVSQLRANTEILFRPHLRTFRRDSRFPRLTAQLGLLQFWRDTGRWPDFCSDPGLTYDCKAQAVRLLGAPSVAGGARAVTAEPKAA